MKARPADLTEEQVKAASEGKSEQVLAKLLGKREPVKMTEDEIKAAAQGRSEEVRAKKDKERP